MKIHIPSIIYSSNAHRSVDVVINCLFINDVKLIFARLVVELCI